jgi:hypothetical protein
MIRKIWIAAAIALLAPAAGYGQYSVDGLFREFSGMPGVAHVNIGKLLMRFAGMIGKDTFGAKSLEVLSFSDCDPTLKSRLNEAVRLLKDGEYETLFRTNDAGERVSILLKIKDDAVREVVVITSGDDPALIRIRGKIRTADVERMIRK